MRDDPSYHAARASEERRLAMASANAHVRRVHLEMARRYDALVGSSVIVASDVAAEPEQRTA